jgi:hypothetical protein
LRADLLHDAGSSLNPALDIGQVEGAFIQGMGWLTVEELWWNKEGKLMTSAPSTYKIPAVNDCPADFRVRLFKNANHEDTILCSKAVGEPPLLTDEPLGVEAFQFAKSAARLVLLVPVIPHVAHDKQRETAAERAKKGPSARRYTQQPARHRDHWLHENVDLPNTHMIAYAADGTNRVDLTPVAQREFAVEPQLDVSADGMLVAVTRQTPGADRELDTTILLIDIASTKQTVFGAGTNVSNAPVYFSPDGTMLATVRSFRSPHAVMRPTLMLIDIASGTERELARDWDRWPHLAAWSNDGQRLIVTADAASHTPVFTIDAASDAVKRLTSFASGGVHTNIAVLTDGRLAGIRSTLLDTPECLNLLSSQHTPHAPTPLPSCAACPDRAAVGRWEVLPQGWRQKAF